MVRVYLACKMTGRYAWELNKEMKQFKRIFSEHNIVTVHPWEWEHMFYKWNQKIHATSGNRAVFWKRDKEAIRWAHVVVDTTGHLFSRGAGCEMTLQLGLLRRPGVWVDNVESIRCDEGYVVTTPEEAAKLIVKNWGTWWKRVWWRVTNVWTVRNILQSLVDEFNSWR